MVMKDDGSMRKTVKIWYNFLLGECRLMDLEKEIKKIQERNKMVELDKSWETSSTRKICIMILTYIVI